MPKRSFVNRSSYWIVPARRAANAELNRMPRMVESAPNRIVISNMMTTYGGIDPTGLPPTTIGQSTDIQRDRKSTRLNSSHDQISYAVFCLKKKNHYTLSKSYSKCKQ